MEKSYSIQDVQPNTKVLSETSEARKHNALKRNHFAANDDVPDMEANKPLETTNPSKAIVGRWTTREHEIFIDSLKKYGKNWDKIESKIPTRSGTQIRSHAQKFFARIRKEFNTKDPMKYVQKNM